MSVPPIPPPPEHLGERPFSFYPPILNIEHNEWRFRKATWSEILVVNTKTDGQIWVPRRYLGEISRIDEPVMIMGLNRELEYKAGTVWPHERRVIELPRGVPSRPPAEAAAPPPGPFSAMLRDTGTESQVGRLIALVAAAGILACFLVVLLFRGQGDGEHVAYRPVMQSDLGLTGRDDFHAVLRRLGNPADDHWLAESGEMQYRVLDYPDRGIRVILMGIDRDKSVYIGSLGRDGKPVDSVQLPHGHNTLSMLRTVSVLLAKQRK